MKRKRKTAKRTRTKAKRKAKPKAKKRPKAKRVRIACEGTELVEIDELRELQGELKELTEENYQKLRGRIAEQGFSAPLFVWGRGKRPFIIDGHQRVRTLKRMRDEGWKVPSIEDRPRGADGQVPVSGGGPRRPVGANRNE